MLRWIMAAGTCLFVSFGMTSINQPQTSLSPALAVQVGLTPESLAAAGLDAMQATALLSRMDDATEAVGAFGGAAAGLDAAINELIAMDRVLATNPDDEETATARNALSETLPGLQSQVASAKSALIFIGLQGLDSESQSRLERFMSAAGSTLPASMRVYPLTAIERRALEAALTAERRASQGGTTVDSSVASMLTACRSHPDVVAAMVGLSSNLAAIEAVYAAGTTR
ncbi:MAG: hypothetical protein IT436_14000 [Phycisphaerales bacterium]|nr:hypothetical protein [Phycisphaerales bacterium]